MYFICMSTVSTPFVYCSNLLFICTIITHDQQYSNIRQVPYTIICKNHTQGIPGANSCNRNKTFKPPHNGEHAFRLISIWLGITSYESVCRIYPFNWLLHRFDISVALLFVVLILVKKTNCLFYNIPHDILHDVLQEECQDVPQYILTIFSLICNLKYQQNVFELMISCILKTTAAKKIH